jgi:hypothetical protein
MKTFLQHLSEAGIQRKLRVLKATRKQAETGSDADWKQYKLAGQDVDREQRLRTGRVIKRARTAAETSEPPVTVGGIYAHVERLERVGEKAAGYAGQMAGAEKPGFANRRFSNLVSRGNDGN